MKNLFGCCAALLVTILAVSGCDRESKAMQAVPGGDVRRGAASIDRFGCGSCHDIPGIGRAQGQVGPALKGIRNRTHIAGVLTNSPENMIHWIRKPRDVDPRTAMPDLGVSEQEARDIVAYLYSK
jgi:cytochrome c